MTIEECIVFAEDINRTVAFPEECKEDEDFFLSVADYLNDLAEYLRELKVAKQPKKPILKEDFYGKKVYICPSCNNFFLDKLIDEGFFHYCPDCGQKWFDYK